MNLAQLVVDQRACISGEAADIGTFVVRNLCNGLGAEVIAKNSDMAGATRQKVDLLAAVDGEEVGRSVMRNLHRVEARERGDPDGARAAAPVISPRDERGEVKSERRAQR